MSIEEANKKVHSVESQWHHPIMAAGGYVPDTKEATGLVRSYSYTHPDTEHSITVTTGYSADHWADEANNAHGYWGSLEGHIAGLAKAAEPEASEAPYIGRPDWEHSYR